MTSPNTTSITLSEQCKDCGLLRHEPIERCNDCGLLHEPWSNNTCKESDYMSSDSYSSSWSMEQDSVKFESSRCQLRYLPMCSTLSDKDISESSISSSFLNGDVGWNSCMIKAHSTNNLNWTSSWCESHNQVDETTTVNFLFHQPATLTSCALQVLDNAGYLDFNIQDPSSLEAALTRVGAVDQLPVGEVSLHQNKSNKRVSFYLPGDDVGLDESVTSIIMSSLSLSHKDGQVFILKDVLSQVLNTLSPIQMQAIAIISDQPRHTLDNSWFRTSNESLEKAFSSMSPLQSLAAAVEAGIVDSKSLPAVVDADFIKKNVHSGKYELKNKC